MVRSHDTNEGARRIDRDDCDDFAMVRSHDTNEGARRIDRDDCDDFAMVRSHDTNEGVLRIDCDDCAMQGTDCCADCLVTFICSREPGEAVVVDVAEARALRMLSEAGLLPASRHIRRTG
jgi:hypothetical protein